MESYLIMFNFFSLQKAKKSYQKDLENSQRNVDGDTSAAPGDGCVWFSCFCI
jgi:WW domain-binding protein 4